jgi:glutathione synthase/RimK-type ligase-like ATP-grasp enzyme
VLSEVLPGGTFPVIVRPLGSHAGFGLDRIDDTGALRDYLGKRPEEEFFVSPYVDYAGADGLFRKYRIVVIGGKAYACHMAVADQWKVWYLNADMALSVPNRIEEAVFMQFFESEFAARHAHALDEMARRIGLDYFIVDCAETRDGKLLVFEADNSAIVHDMDPPNVYPYKPAQMQIIFNAFAAMLHERATRAKSCAA